jgi:uncharacterized protein YprB with RNaseH-like and TPR domain
MPEIWRHLWDEKVSKTVPDYSNPSEIFIQKAGILAEFGKIICISTAFIVVENGITNCRIKSFYGDDEKLLLQTFVEMCVKLEKAKPQFQFAGHNIREFDIPYICRRMIIQQLPLPNFLQIHGAKPWEVKMVDTLQWWKFGDYKNYISLHLLASVLGVPTSKTDIDGSMVRAVYYEEKNIERIVTYCQKDVVVVANIILRFRHQPLLDDALVHITQPN